MANCKREILYALEIVSQVSPFLTMYQELHWAVEPALVGAGASVYMAELIAIALVEEELAVMVIEAEILVDEDNKVDGEPTIEEVVVVQLWIELRVLVAEENKPRLRRIKKMRKIMLPSMSG